MANTIRNFVIHGAALIAAIVYGRQIAFGPYSVTGLMFVAPVLVMLIVYCVFDAWRYRGQIVASRIFGELAIGGTILLGGVLISLALLPTQSSAANDHVTQFFVFLVCMTILALIVFIIVWFVRTLFRVLVLLFSSNSGKDPDDRNKLNGFASVAFVFATLSLMSLEGTPFGFAFSPEGEVSAQIYIEASPDSVWTAMSTASSPKLELPLLLSMLPRPVSIIDEGGETGDKRIIHFAGREGEGDMVLVAQPRIGNSQSWHVTADTSPLSMWARMQTITYAVEPTPSGTTLTVKATYLRRLSPAWFFKPYMNIVIGEAASVLARDKHDRALVEART